MREDERVERKREDIEIATDREREEAASQYLLISPIFDNKTSHVLRIDDACNSSDHEYSRIMYISYMACAFHYNDRHLTSLMI